MALPETGEPETMREFPFSVLSVLLTSPDLSRADLWACHRVCRKFREETILSSKLWSKYRVTFPDDHAAPAFQNFQSVLRRRPEPAALALKVASLFCLEFHDIISIFENKNLTRLELSAAVCESAVCGSTQLPETCTHLLTPSWVPEKPHPHLKYLACDFYDEEEAVQVFRTAREVFPNLQVLWVSTNHICVEETSLPGSLRAVYLGGAEMDLDLDSLPNLELVSSTNWGWFPVQPRGVSSSVKWFLYETHPYDDDDIFETLPDMLSQTSEHFPFVENLCCLMNEGVRDESVEPVPPHLPPLLKLGYIRIATRHQHRQLHSWVQPDNIPGGVEDMVIRVGDTWYTRFGSASQIGRSSISQHPLAFEGLDSPQFRKFLERWA